jgi:hypothetical protein
MPMPNIKISGSWLVEPGSCCSIACSWAAGAALTGFTTASNPEIVRIVTTQSATMLRFEELMNAIPGTPVLIKTLTYIIKVWTR